MFPLGIRTLFYRFLFLKKSFNLLSRIPQNMTEGKRVEKKQEIKIGSDKEKRR